MKVVIVTDLEGVSGVVNSESQCSPGGPYYEDAKRLLMGEVNAATDGLIEAGADEVVVIDGHGPGALHFPDLHPAASAIIGHPFPVGWGLDRSYDAQIMIGYHAMAGVMAGVLDHTESSRTIVNCWLNGRRIGEIGLYSALAGHFGVPTIMVSGDKAATDEALEFLGPIEVATVKHALGRGSALCVSPVRAQAMIREAAARALRRRDEIPPFTVAPPYELRIEYLNSDAALRATLGSRHVERVDARTVVCRGGEGDLPDVIWVR